MQKREKYNTRQKNIILDVIKKQNYEFTIKDIYVEIKDSVGLTTIYRFIDKLIEEGNLTKVIGKDNITYYQYLEKCNHEDHFYLKCDKCGSIIHIDCNCIVDLNKHISREHNFLINNTNVVINGVCSQCLKKVI